MVRVYQWSGDSFDWAQLGQKIEGETEGDQSGFQSALSSDGMTLAIGAIYNSGNGTNISGHSHIYKWGDANEWYQAGQDIDGEAARDQSGFSIDLSADGKTVAIGATSNNGNGNDSGHVRVYRWDEAASNWSKVGQDIDGESAGEMAGQSVSISSDGSIVAIGSIGANAGQARVFQFSSR